MKDPIIERVKLTEIRANPSNPRELSREKFEELVKSIKDFPKMLAAEPLKIADGLILSGNQRYQALKLLGHKEAYVQKLDNFTEEERLEYIIKANVHAGIFDYDMLANGNQWEERKLKEWGVMVWQPDEEPKPPKLFGTIQIEFNEEDYETASELIKSLRTTGEYIGREVLEVLLQKFR
tara:strand:+ start:9610 stop:10146 length:537 start_codon:yes stop_codon:yes gene_type:complete